MTDLVSRVYRPAADKCCEACCFGNGTHALWCPEGKAVANAAAFIDLVAVIHVNTRSNRLYDILFGPADGS